VRQLAVRPVDRPPVLDQVQDRLLFPGQQPVHRVAARRQIGQGAVVAQPGAPTVHPHILDTQDVAGAGVRPPRRDRVVDQLEQPLFDVAVDAGGQRSGR
jgi:hypothetical protein